MNYVALIELGEYLNNLSIPDIPSTTNFWLVRSKGGYFYDEFVSEEFVALGWNHISKETSLDKNNIELLKEEIKERYGDKRPGTAIGKCKRFIEDVHEGDYVLIPNSGGSEVTIGIIGEYYEEEISCLEELIAIKKIENRECEIGRVKCPYKKRRRISIIMTISSTRLGHKIMRGMSSYHGISDMNEYAVDILNCIYDCYTYNGDMRISVNIAKKSPIKARELATLMYSVTELFCSFMDEDSVSVTMNLNSPGKATVILKDGYTKVKKAVVPLIGISLFLFGGSGFGFEFPGVISGVIDSIVDAKTASAQIEMVEAELKGKQLENYKTSMEILKLSEETGVDVDKVLEELKRIEALSDSLKFESNKDFAKDDNVIEQNEEK